MKNVLYCHSTNKGHVCASADLQDTWLVSWSSSFVAVRTRRVYLPCGPKTVPLKEIGCWTLVRTLSNLNRFKKFCHTGKRTKFPTNVQYNHHLRRKHVATLRYLVKRKMQNYGKQAVREVATICPAPCKLTFDFLTLRVVSESCVTWATSVPILVFLYLSVLDLGPMYATDVRYASSLNASALWGLGHNNARIMLQNFDKNIVNSFWTNFYFIFSPF